MKFTLRRTSKTGANSVRDRAGAAKLKVDKTNKRKSKHTASRVQTYHAVTICSRLKKCAAAEGISDQAYLSSQAPVLPLQNCDQAGSCACKYQHQDDRRGEMRRDSDFGLPGRRYDEQDRREGPETRRSA